MNSLRSILTLTAAMSLPLIFGGRLAAQTQEDQALVDPQVQNATTDQTEAASPEQLGFQDQELAAMLILQHSKQHEISQFVAERAESEKVRQFAEKGAREHGEFIRTLHVDELMDETGPRIAGVLRDMAQQMRERQEAIAQQDTGQRRVLGFRGTDDDDAESVSDSQDDRSAIREQRQNVRDERQDVRGSRRADRDGIREDVREEVREERAELREGREELRETRQAARQERRQGRGGGFVREFLPVLRQNLPEILDIVGQAVEEGSMASNQNLALYKQCVDRHIETIKHELENKQGAKFDEAYLHFSILAHLEMIDSMKTVRDYASSDFRPTLDQGLAMAEGHLQDARSLLSEIGEDSSENN